MCYLKSKYIKKIKHNFDTILENRRHGCAIIIFVAL